MTAHYTDTQVQAAIASAVARERERCIALCDGFQDKALAIDDFITSTCIDECIRAIRALPDGGATTEEPAKPDALALFEDYERKRGTSESTEARAALRAALSASSVGGATTEGTTP